MQGTYLAYTKAIFFLERLAPSPTNRAQKQSSSCAPRTKLENLLSARQAFENRLPPEPDQALSQPNVGESYRCWQSNSGDPPSAHHPSVPTSTLGGPTIPRCSPSTLEISPRPPSGCVLALTRARPREAVHTRIEPSRVLSQPSTPVVHQTTRRAPPAYQAAKPPLAPSRGHPTPTFRDHPTHGHPLSSTLRRRAANMDQRKIAEAAEKTARYTPPAARDPSPSSLRTESIRIKSSELKSSIYSPD